MQAEETLTLKEYIKTYAPHLKKKKGLSLEDRWKMLEQVRTEGWWECYRRCEEEIKSGIKINNK